MNFMNFMYQISQDKLVSQLEKSNFDYNKIILLTKIKTLYINCNININRIVLIKNNFEKQQLTLLELIQLINNKSNNLIYPEQKINIIFDQENFDLIIKMFPSIEFTRIEKI